MSRLLYEGSKATFLEDAEMLEAVQMNRQGGSLDGLIDIGADAAQLQARRMLAGMIEESGIDRHRKEEASSTTGCISRRVR